MSDAYEDEYGNWMDNIEQELIAFEGEGPPEAETLISLAHHETGGLIGRIEAMQKRYDLEYNEAETLLGDVLRVRVMLALALGYRERSDDLPSEIEP